MVINTNNAALASARMLSNSSQMLTKSLARLSSGSRLNSPEDDPAGLGQSIKFDAQKSRNSAVISNVGNAISYAQTQDGFLQKVQQALDRMSEISVLAQDVTKTDTDRSNYSAEFIKIQNFISNVGSKSFNGVLLFGVNQFTATGMGVTIDSDGATFSMSTINFTETGANGGLEDVYDPTNINVSTTSASAIALMNIKSGIQNLAAMRATIGAHIQRLNFTNEGLAILNENLSAANSRIRDVDVAVESTRLARYNILVQSGTAMLAQANILPQSALRLLG